MLPIRYGNEGGEEERERKEGKGKKKLFRIGRGCEMGWW